MLFKCKVVEVSNSAPTCALRLDIRAIFGIFPFDVLIEFNLCVEFGR